MKIQSRAFMAIGGQAVMLFAGMVYSWSVISSPIAAEFTSWNKLQLSFTFTLVMIMFCVGGLIGGLLNGKTPLRTYLLASAALFLLGFTVTARANSLTELYIGFGILCGLASGLAYNGVMSAVCAWFPEKQGFISGCLLMAFGIGSFFIGKFFQELTPNFIGAWRTSFFYFGLIISVVLIVFSFFLKAPKKGFTAPTTKKSKASFINPVSVEASAKEMLTERTFWLYYAWAVFISFAGFSLISQAGFIAREVDPSVSPGTVATVVGLISVFNGVGRILAGVSFDRYGRRLTMRVINCGFILTAAVLAAAILTERFSLIILGFILGGLSYGGVTPTNSAFTNSYFGNSNYPVNFSITNSNLIIASFGSTISGALFDATHSYLSAILFMAIMAMLGMVLSSLISINCNKIIAKKNLEIKISKRLSA